jgi:hypothetical protein
MLGFAFAAYACAPASSDAPLRSPTRDYPPPPSRTSDGQVVGADNVTPDEKLEQGPRAGSDEQLSPGWKADEKGLHYDPKARTGGAVDQKPEREPRP